MLDRLVRTGSRVVVAAEAEVPLAMADAFRNGRLGVMDYYNMKNVEADTQMRRSIGGEDSPDSGSGSGDDRRKK